MSAEGRLEEIYSHSNSVVTVTEELQSLETELKETRDKLECIGYVSSLPESYARPVYIIGFSSLGLGRLILSVNNPDSADHVATYVPGTTARLGRCIGDIKRTISMAEDSADLKPSDVTAVAFWLGYDAPQNINPEAALAIYAERAAPALRLYQEGLRATHRKDVPAHHTVLGHSYGTVAVGAAAKVGFNTDDIVLVASPGALVSRASELHLHGKCGSVDNVYATKAENDPIKWAIHPKVLLGGDAVAMMIHGINPANPVFGGRIFRSWPGGENAHSEYWLDGNPSRIGMALIIVGRGGEVS